MSFVLPRCDYAVAVCAVSTLFMLARDAQLGCLCSTAAHLRSGGRLLVGTVRPDPTRFGAQGLRVEDRSTPEGGRHVVCSTHDALACPLRITQELDEGTFEVTLYYWTTTELDTLASKASPRPWTQLPTPGSS